MNHMKIIQQAWATTWRYKALWIFGILLALSSGGGGGAGGGNSGAQFSGNGGEWSGPSSWPFPEIGSGVIIATIVALCSFIILFTFFTVIMRYVSETALIRMVDEHETSGVQRSVKEGFRLGWSRGAWKLLLLDLLVLLVIGTGLTLVFLLAAAPLLALIADSALIKAMGIVGAIGLVMAAIFLAIAVGIVVNTLLHFIRRFVILEGKGVFDAIREGFAFVRVHLKDVALMWLFMFGINLAFMLVTIPLVLLLVVLGAVAGGLPGLALGGLVSLVMEGDLAWVIGVGIGVLIFIAVVAVPSLFVGGVYKTFESSVWTLTYRELRAMAQIEVGTPEVPAPPEVALEGE